MLATRLIAKIDDPSYANEYFNSCFRKKITKLVKRSKLTTQQLKAIENPNIVDIKSVTIKHSKTSRKLSKTEKVS